MRERPSQMHKRLSANARASAPSAGTVLVFQIWDADQTGLVVVECNRCSSDIDMTVLRHSDCDQFSEQFSGYFGGSEWI